MGDEIFGNSKSLVVQTSSCFFMSKINILLVECLTGCLLEEGIYSMHYGANIEFMQMFSSFKNIEAHLMSFHV